MQSKTKQFRTKKVQISQKNQNEIMVFFIQIDQ